MRHDAERLPPDGPGAQRLQRAATAAHELCEVLWEELHEELREPSHRRVRELSQRLGEISSTLAMLAAQSRPAGGSPSPGQAGEEEPGAQPPAQERRTPPRPVGEERRSAFPPSWEPPAAGPVRLVDEHRQEPAGRREASPAGEGRTTRVREVRPEEGPSAWVNIVGELLARHTVDGLPFAVLLVELVDVARMQYADTPEQLNRLIVQVEEALCRALRADDELTRESWGRYWLVAPETNGTGARMLAERVAELVRTSVTHRGAPLEVAVGIAVCPEDGVEAAALAACADLGVYTARATGRPVARSQPPA